MCVSTRHTGKVLFVTLVYTSTGVEDGALVALHVGKEDRALLPRPGRKTHRLGPRKSVQDLKSLSDFSPSRPGAGARAGVGLRKPYPRSLDLSPLLRPPRSSEKTGPSLLRQAQARLGLQTGLRPWSRQSYTIE